jgi:hypothetical protein
MPLPNRLAVYVTGLVALIGGLTPLVGNLDWESTAGVLAAVAAIAGVVGVWLNNWGKWERAEEAQVSAELDELDDGFDEASAPPVPEVVVAAAHAPVPDLQETRLTDEERIERERKAQLVDDELASRGIVPPGPAGG